MLLQDLNTGNNLQNKITAINLILASYEHLHITQGLQATSVTIQFSDFGAIHFEDSDASVVPNLAASLITNITNYRTELQQQFDDLGNGGGAL